MNVRSGLHIYCAFAICNIIHFLKLKIEGEKECGDLNLLSGDIFCMNVTSGVPEM